MSDVLEHLRQYTKVLMQLCGIQHSSEIMHPGYFLDSARLHVNTPPGFVLYHPKMAMLPDTLSTV
jgi:hypothetical protein